MSQLGQMIVLDGVSPPAAPGAIILDISQADVIAAQMAGLKSMMAPKRLTALPGGGVAGFCSAGSGALIPKGTVTALRLTKVNNKPALGLNSGTAAAALAFQPGTASKSYTVAMVCNVADVTDRVNFMMGYTGETTPILTGLRFDITASSPDVKKLIAYGSSNNAPYAENYKAAGLWQVVVFDYDDVLKKVSLSINGGAFVEMTTTADSPVGPTSYFEVGYHGSLNSLRTSNVGDTYVFNYSVRSNAAEITKLNNLVAALKTEYGIT